MLANEAVYHNRWRRLKASAGQVAIRTTLSRYSILPSGEPLLTASEMEAGRAYIEEGNSKPPEAIAVLTLNMQHVAAWPKEPTDDEWVRIEAYADKRGCSYDDAYRAIME